MSTVASLRFSDLFALASSSLKRNRLRSGLTIGAVAVGISVMMYLISFGLGLEDLTVGSIRNSSALLSITVTSGSEKLQPLNQSAVAKIQKLPKVAAVLPQVTLKGSVALDNHTASVTLTGADPDYLTTNDATTLVTGRVYRPDDQQTMVVTSGFLRLFGLDENKTPLISFTLVPDKDEYPASQPVPEVSVVGVIKADATQVYVPRPYLESLAAGNLPSYDNLKVKVATLDDIDPVSDSLIANGFQVSKVVDTVAQIKQVFFWIQAVMGGLGLIAIFVASIGMFNTLTVSLLERTREIGIMKALGAKKSDIWRLFLAESLLMGFLGGLLGTVMAFFFQQVTLFLLSLLASLSKGTVPTIFSNQWYVILGFIALSLLIAAVTGVYPARRAARINPMEAIRYE